MKTPKSLMTFKKKRVWLYFLYYKRTFFENGEDFGVFYKVKSTYEM